MNLIEFKKEVKNNSNLYTIPMQFLEALPGGQSKNKIVHSNFYNGNLLIEKFYKKIHRL